MKSFFLMIDGFVRAGRRLVGLGGGWFLREWWLQQQTIFDEAAVSLKFLTASLRTREEKLDCKHGMNEFGLDPPPFGLDPPPRALHQYVLTPPPPPRLVNNH